MQQLKRKNLERVRLRVVIHGAVQGVGFRPFVYRLATEMKLPGWVSNSGQGVFIEVESAKDTLNQFLFRLQKEIPPRACIQSLEFLFLDATGFTLFEIRKSDSAGIKTVLVLPDISTCPDCLKDIFDTSNRRYLYPFTNCTNCGSRFSIIEALPYDRPNSSMKKFEMCPDCKAEYENPFDRRFHAQPNACPLCGPKLELWNDKGNVIAERHNALLQAVEILRTGKIVAVKGIGGFHLMVDARNDEAVRRLRTRKHREEKPLALMFPLLEAIKLECEVNEFEERLLLSPESPIVLLKRLTVRNPQSFIASSVAPSNPYLGVMLPYTPLHHILLKELGFPVVATSGNLSDEPICTDENEALHRLNGITDMFLVHNRPIVRHVDDSIVRVIMGRELVLRRARGYAPLPISVGTRHGVSLLAVGAHLKNTIALTSDDNVFISQHIGDLETMESLDAFHRVITDFQMLYETKPAQVVCDLHPDYLSSKFARSTGIPFIEIQHHYAHIASCMAENQLEGKLLGVSWDGTGYGLDGTIWGGEFLLTTETSFEHIATFRSFRLPGGEKAIKEPRRIALGILYEIFGDNIFHDNDLISVQAFTPAELDVLKQMFVKNINMPVTTSAGRLFDAVASLIGLRQIVNYEGQAAMELEFLIQSVESEECYPFGIDEALKLRIVDWRSVFEGILTDIKNHISPSTIAAKFHNTLVEIIVAVAMKIKHNRVVLSGGCFQNKYLTEHTVKRLREEGFRPYWHQRVPPNDGGIALGQAYAALRLQNANRA
ncbi:MAG: carbamoyltransferase HypF [Ignavibacteriales bacterium]|nr:carbamoyltransferase HypF [Ignavibacteriales bacterium]